jgi:DUF971 family protein
MSPQITPTRLDLKKTEKLTIEWQDGRACTYSVSLLRSMCPCALCKLQRDQRDPHQLMTEQAPTKKTSLTVLPGNYAEPIVVKDASLVGNYAMKIEWSDGHDSGIYSFEYLRSICPS